MYRRFRFRNMDVACQLPFDLALVIGIQDEVEGEPALDEVLFESIIQSFSD